MEIVGQKLRRMRKILGWSQEDMAREIGVSLSTVHRWETKGGKLHRLAQISLQRIQRENGIKEDLWNTQAPLAL